MGVETWGGHEGIRVFLWFPALVLGCGGELGRGLSYLKCCPGPVSG